MKVQIIGFYTEYEYGYGGYTGQKTGTAQRLSVSIVATFDCEKDAKKYIKDSRLKNPKNRIRPFRKQSLLSLFEFATIEEEEVGDFPPHNPKIGKRSK